MPSAVATSLGTIGAGVLASRSQSKAAKTQAQADALALAEAQRRQDYEDAVREDETRYNRAQEGRNDYVSRQGQYQSAVNRSPIVNEFYDRMGYKRPEIFNANDVAKGYSPAPYTPPPRSQSYQPTAPPPSGGGNGTRNTLLTLGLGLGGAAIGKYMNRGNKVPVQTPQPYNPWSRE